MPMMILTGELPFLAGVATATPLIFVEGMGVWATLAGGGGETAGVLAGAEGASAATI